MKESEAVQLATPTQDERLMAALAHGSIVLPMWGLILSAMIWVTQREKSPYVRHQGAQAIAWHAAEIVLLFIGFACYFLSFFGSFSVLAASNFTGAPPSYFRFFPALPLLAMSLMMLAALIFIIVGIIATVRALQGRRFMYPIVGQRVDMFLETRPA